MAKTGGGIKMDYIPVGKRRPTFYQIYISYVNYTAGKSFSVVTWL